MRDAERLASRVERFRGQPLDAYYLGYFECFNQRQYFEAHELLEVLWLRERGKPEELFYKGLIQFAGAFVHLQKARPGPATALFRLARKNLAQYPNYHQELDVAALVGIIDRWLEHLTEHKGSFRPEQAPQLLLGQQAFVLRG